MKVLISWSGGLSKQIGVVLKDWIENVLQGTEAWISTDDIDKGSIWFGDISDELADTSVGILCLTRENIEAPWVLFEAGALFKGLSKNRVCPLLVNLNHADLKPPLSQFNATLPSKDDMLKLTRVINAENGKQRLADERLEKAFERWWDDFEQKFAAILKGYKPAKEMHKRPTEDILEEVLETARAMQRSLQSQWSFLNDLGSSLAKQQAIGNVVIDQFVKNVLTPRRKLVGLYTAPGVGPSDESAVLDPPISTAAKVT
jgi:hypothetical protein